MNKADKDTLIKFLIILVLLLGYLYFFNNDCTIIEGIDEDPRFGFCAGNTHKDETTRLDDGEATEVTCNANRVLKDGARDIQGNDDETCCESMTNIRFGYCSGNTHKDETTRLEDGEATEVTCGDGRVLVDDANNIKSTEENICCKVQETNARFGYCSGNTHKDETTRLDDGEATEVTCNAGRTLVQNSNTIRSTDESICCKGPDLNARFGYCSGNTHKDAYTLLSDNDSTEVTCGDGRILVDNANTIRGTDDEKCCIDQGPPLEKMCVINPELWDCRADNKILDNKQGTYERCLLLDESNCEQGLVDNDICDPSDGEICPSRCKWTDYTEAKCPQILNEVKALKAKLLEEEEIIKEQQRQEQQRQEVSGQKENEGSGGDAEEDAKKDAEDEDKNEDDAEDEDNNEDGNRIYNEIRKTMAEIAFSLNSKNSSEILIELEGAIEKLRLARDSGEKIDTKNAAFVATIDIMKNLVDKLDDQIKEERIKAGEGYQNYQYI